MYDELKKIQKFLWKNDDMIMQDDLFQLQEFVADLTLKIAKKENKIDDLVKNFSWLYNKV